MKKETFVKLVNAWKKNQKQMRKYDEEKYVPRYWHLFSKDIFEILENECEFLWWVTQKPKTGHWDGKDYPVKTVEEFWEYTKICKRK